MSFEITGKLTEKFDTQQVTSSFRKREFVIEKHEMAGTFEKVDEIKFQITQDRCDMLDNLNRGDEIAIQFNIRGRRWEKDGRVSFFTNLEAWRVEKVTAQAAPDMSAPGGDDSIPLPPPPADDDLPF